MSKYCDLDSMQVIGLADGSTDTVVISRSEYDDFIRDHMRMKMICQLILAEKDGFNYIDVRPMRFILDLDKEEQE